MIEQVEKVGAEAETLALGDLESLADGKVHVRLVWSDDAVAGSVAVAGGISGRAAGQWYDRIWHVGRGVGPVAEPGLVASGCGSVRTTEPGGESWGCEVRAAQSVSASSSRINRRKWQAGLQRDHAAEFPSAESACGKAACVREERQLVDRAKHEALRAVEIRKSARVAGVGLIVEAGIEGDGGRRNIVNRLGKSVRGLKIQSLGKAVRDGCLQRIVVRVGIRSE